MSIVVSEKITDNVFGAVWLAALIMTYEEKVLKDTNNIYFDQVDIQNLAQKLCIKTVQSARISQWCNGDHPRSSYNYLRSYGSKRRLTRVGEFNFKEYPERFLNSDMQVLVVQITGKQVEFGELFEWYLTTYSKKEYIAESNDELFTSNNVERQIIKSTNEMQEDEIKVILANYLNHNGWQTKLAMGKEHGIDIDATKGSDRWIIEVKGCGSRNAMRVNYFLAILGETLQRMSDPNAKYSIALPDMQQYRKLWERLPQLAKERTGISVLFVSEDNQIEEVI